MDLYDTIGVNYRQRRRPDPRIAARIAAALEGCATVLNVGAGAGSYEPQDRRVVAVEPSTVMIRQRPANAAPVVRASAAALPFGTDSFDACLAVLTMHHWPDPWRGLAELRRVARLRVVVLTCDPSIAPFWLYDYFPELLTIDRHILPPLSVWRRQVPALQVVGVPIPHDCSDGFLGAYWRRPEAYLEAEVRAAISTFSKLRRVEAGVEALRRDLASGAWRARYDHRVQQDELDLGYRLLVVGPPFPGGGGPGNPQLG